MTEDRSPVESWLWDACPGEPVGYVKGKLAEVLFSGDDAKKKLGNLSGGEAARLVFARLSVEAPNVLVLDEPTNHLDLEAIESLVSGLKQYEGTLILVSHDRWFVSQLADRILEIRHDGVEDYRGTYEEYVRFCGDDHLDAEAALRKARKEKRRAKVREAADPVKRTGDLSRLKKEQDELAEAIERDEKRVAEINEIFCDPAYFEKTPRKEVARLEKEQNELSERIAESTKRWESLEEEISATA